MEDKLTPPELSPNTNEELPDKAKEKGLVVVAAVLLLSKGVDNEPPNVEEVDGFVVVTDATPAVDWGEEEAT
jgi:hypothetical protein